MFNQLVLLALLALFGTSDAVTRKAAFKAGKAAVGGINDITTLVLGVKGMVDLVTGEAEDKTEAYHKEVMEKMTEIQKTCAKIEHIKKQVRDLSIAVQENTNKIISSVEFNNAKEVVAHFNKKCDYIASVFKNRYGLTLRLMESFRPDGGNKPLRGLIYDYSLDMTLSHLFSDLSSSVSSQTSIFAAMAHYYDRENDFMYKCESISPLDDLHIFYVNVLTTLAKGYSLLLLSQRYHELTADPEDVAFYREQQNITVQTFRDTIVGMNENTKRIFNSLHLDRRTTYACDPSEWREGRDFIRVKNYVTSRYDDKNWLTPDKYPTPEEVAKLKEVDCPGGLSYFVGGPPLHSYRCGEAFNPEPSQPEKQHFTEIEGLVKEYRVWESRKCTSASAYKEEKWCQFDKRSDPFLSIRKVSLRVKECDQTRNEVVVDARFIEEDNLIKPQLLCAEFNNGEINMDTMRWTDDTWRYSGEEIAVLDINLKSFNIDNVVVDNDYLLTGAGFEVVDGKFLSLVVQGRRVFNYYGKTELKHEGELFHAPKPEKPRTNIDISWFHRLPPGVGQTHELSKAGQHYVTLTLAKWSRERNNHGVVPYFDMTPYRRERCSVPLSGLGLMYKSRGEYAGLLAFKHLSVVHLHFLAVNTTLAAPELEE